MSSFLIPWKKKSTTGMQIEPDAVKENAVIRETAELAITENGDLSGKAIPERPEPEMPEKPETPKLPGEDSRNKFLNDFCRRSSKEESSFFVTSERDIRNEGYLVRILIALHRFVFIQNMDKVYSYTLIDVGGHSISITMIHNMKIVWDRKEVFRLYDYRADEYYNILNIENNGLIVPFFEEIIEKLLDINVHIIDCNIRHDSSISEVDDMSRVAAIIRNAV